MNGKLLLAIRYLLHHRLKTITLVAALTLTLFAPFAMHLLLRQFEESFVARANATPLVVGAKGSRVDLVLHALYFAAKPDENITMGDADAIAETNFATALPLHFRHTAHSVPVVGVTYDYFGFRNLRVAKGEGLLMLGDCLLGSAAAGKLDLEPGDYLLTDLDNVFNIAGEYPLRLLVRGILAPTNTPDDEVLFVDLKTAWVVDGIAHGHDDLSSQEQNELLLSRTEDTVVASAAVAQYTEITPENVGSFHLHAERDELPISAVIAVPKDEKSGVLLRGRYQSSQAVVQTAVPLVVVTEVLDAVFRVKRLFDAAFVSIVITTLLFLALVIVLSLRLRAAERRTMHHLGSSRGTIALLFCFEYLIIFAMALLLATSLALLLSWTAPGLLRIVFLN